MLAVADVDPGTDDLERFSGRVSDQMLFVADPAIVAVLFAEAVFGGVAIALEQRRLLGLDALDIVGMYPGAPEIRILEISSGQ